MKHINLVSALIGCLVSFGAQAGITQVPTGPTQVRLNYASDVTSTSAIDNLSPPQPLSYDLTALGNAHIEANKTWVADVTEVSGGLIRVGGDDAGLTLTETGPSGAHSLTWKNITIDLTMNAVTGDSYVDGLLADNDQTLFSFGDPLNAYPEGQAMLFRGLLVGHLTLSPVPEPSSGLAMALGLLAVGWGVRRVHRHTDRRA